MSRLTTRPWGLLGGTPGASARLEKNDGTVPVGDMIRLYRGESLGVFTAGGGGYGEPRNRPAALVARDVREGRLDPATAARVYGWSPDQPVTEERP